MCPDILLRSRSQMEPNTSLVLWIPIMAMQQHGSNMWPMRLEHGSSSLIFLESILIAHVAQIVQLTISLLPQKSKNSSYRTNRCFLGLLQCQPTTGRDLY